MRGANLKRKDFIKMFGNQTALKTETLIKEINQEIKYIVDSNIYYYPSINAYIISRNISSILCFKPTISVPSMNSFRNKKIKLSGTSTTPSNLTKS
jgi:hypothetical protein